MPSSLHFMEEKTKENCEWNKEEEVKQRLASVGKMYALTMGQGIFKDQR